MKHKHKSSFTHSTSDLKKKVLTYFRTDFILVIVLGIALFFRFFDYMNRFGLAYDQAHSAIIARYALQTFQIPLLGPFSSGGPFQTGGEWYWIIMIGTALSPFWVIGPWIFLTLLTVLGVFLMFLVGKHLVSQNFGILCSLLTAISTAQITQSTNLSNQTPIIVFSVLALLLMVLYMKTTKLIFLFLMSFFISFGASVHIQGVALVPLLFLTFVLGGFPWKKGFALVLIGAFIPWIPVLMADMHNDFYNTKAMLTFFFMNDSQVTYEVLGRRWLTFITEFIPSAWSFIIGGVSWIGYFLIAGVFIAVSRNILKRNFSREWMIILLSSISMVVILRYLKTPLFESFYVFIHPFVLILSAYLIYQLYMFKKGVGFIALGIVISGTLITNWQYLQAGENITHVFASTWKEELKQKFPGEKFAVYDYAYKYRDKSFPLVLYLMSDDLIDDNGRRIGIAVTSKEIDHSETYRSIIGSKGSYQIFDLEASPSSQLRESEWSFVNPSQVYKSTQSWYTLEE